MSCSSLPLKCQWQGGRLAKLSQPQKDVLSIVFGQEAGALEQSRWAGTSRVTQQGTEAMSSGTGHWPEMRTEEPSSPAARAEPELKSATWSHASVQGAMAEL